MCLFCFLLLFIYIYYNYSVCFYNFSAFWFTYKTFFCIYIYICVCVCVYIFLCVWERVCVCMHVRWVVDFHCMHISRCQVLTCQWARSGTTCWLFWSVEFCTKSAMLLLLLGDLIRSLYASIAMCRFISVELSCILPLSKANFILPFFLCHAHIHVQSCYFSGDMVPLIYTTLQV